MNLASLLTSHNSRVVLAGVSLLGAAAGLVGVFLLLRRRALMADATSHATLPGVALAFLLQPLLGLPAKHLPGLLVGALLAGLAGMALIQGIRRLGRLQEDAAMGIVLSVFYGFGICLLGLIQNLRGGSSAGLKTFIFGKTASMLASDASLIAATALLVLLLAGLLFKEFTLLCFDESFAASQGWPIARLDTLLMGTVVVVTVIGLQAVGLILMIALLVVPPAAARFWSDRLATTLALSGFFGAAGALGGAMASALFPTAPAGALIVLGQGLFFLAGLLFGAKRGVLTRALLQRETRMRLRTRHALGRGEGI